MSTTRQRVVGWVVVAGLAAGCHRSALPDPPDEVQGPTELQGIHVDTTRVDLGRLNWGTAPPAVFTLHNTSNQTATLSLGAASCTCVSATLEPKVLPPGKSARLEMTLNAKDRTGAGRTEACVSVSVNGRGNAFQFCASGYLEGVASTQDYVVRRSHAAANKPPPIRFRFMTQESGSRPEVVAVGFYRDRLGDQIFPMRDAVAAAAGEGQLRAIEPFQVAVCGADLAKMTVSEPDFLPAQNCFARDVEIPVQLRPDPAPPSRGKVVIQYRLRGELRVTVFTFLYTANLTSPG